MFFTYTESSDTATLTFSTQNIIPTRNTVVSFGLSWSIPVRLRTWPKMFIAKVSSLFKNSFYSFLSSYSSRCKLMNLKTLSAQRRKACIFFVFDTLTKMIDSPLETMSAGKLSEFSKWIVFPMQSKCSCSSSGYTNVSTIVL